MGRAELGPRDVAADARAAGLVGLGDERVDLVVGVVAVEVVDDEGRLLGGGRLARARLALALPRREAILRLGRKRVRRWPTF